MIENEIFYHSKDAQLIGHEVTKEDIIINEN